MTRNCSAFDDARPDEWLVPIAMCIPAIPAIPAIAAESGWADGVEPDVVRAIAVAPTASASTDRSAIDVFRFFIVPPKVG